MSIKENTTPESARSAMPGISQGHKMPSIYRQILKTEWFRQFTFRERIAILFGANLVVMIGVATRHRVGEFQPMVIGKVSKHSTPDEHMRECVEGMLEDIKPKAPVENEPIK